MLSLSYREGEGRMKLYEGYQYLKKAPQSEVLLIRLVIIVAEVTVFQILFPFPGLT